MKTMWQKLNDFSMTIKTITVLILAVIVAGGVVMSQNPPRDIRSLSKANPECIQEIADTNSILLKWGAVETEITDPKQIADIISTLGSLQVTEYIYEIDHKRQSYDDYAACQIIWPGVQYLYLSENLQRITGYETEWLNTTPEILCDMFQRYCMETRNALADTTFYVDLTNDNKEELIVVNPMKDRGCFSVYDANGYVLYDIDKKISKRNSNGDYFLYEKEGKYYLLETDLDDIRSLDSNYWRLMQFDESGDIVYAKAELVNIEPENGPDYEHSWYAFDLQELKPFFNEMDEMLQDATLLLSTDGSKVQFSTTTYTVKRTVNDYMDKWYDAMPVLQQTSREQWMRMNMDERLKLCDELLRIDSQYMYAKGWAESYANNDGEARHKLLSDKLWEYVAKVDETDKYEPWMPVYRNLTITRDEEVNNIYYGNETTLHYTLKDGSLTVNNYSVETVKDENGEAIQNTFRIVYDISKDSEETYTYTEQIVFERGNDWPDWLVTECEAIFEKSYP